MPGDSFYWSPVENDTDDSFQEKEGYIDPWDLENYAYIREHLDSMELSSSPSGPSGSSGEFAEATNSFDFIPGKKKPGPPYISKQAPYLTEDSNFESILSEQENYADIEEIQNYERKNRRATSEMQWPIRKRLMEEYEPEVSPYAEGIVQDNPVFGIYDRNGVFRRVALPISYPKPKKDRSLSFSYGDFGNDQYGSSSKPDLYSKLEDNQSGEDSSLPIYDDVGRNMNHLRVNKPQNFSFSKYGHLKIDYSRSWNNLNKYMKYN
ncbi:uncharacterized protein [Leptinotarsa decemlineata]|uniref:uncharacterized protein n=1 Tax=Leptinotarsa decemlineata TaxID=7539 RepID=UPI000C252B99|nr:uncharacterized protein LOC111511867 [Leptinotarsa decemlineata]